MWLRLIRGASMVIKIVKSKPRTKWVRLHDYVIFDEDWSGTGPDQTEPRKLIKFSQWHQPGLTSRTIRNSSLRDWQGWHNIFHDFSSPRDNTMLFSFSFCWLLFHQDLCLVTMPPELGIRISQYYRYSSTGHLWVRPIEILVRCLIWALCNEKAHQTFPTRPTWVISISGTFMSGNLDGAATKQDIELIFTIRR